MTKKWYYAHKGVQAGPVSSTELKKLADDGQLLPTDLVWKEGMSEWVPASKIRNLFSNSSCELGVDMVEQTTNEMIRLPRMYYIQVSLSIFACILSIIAIIIVSLYSTNLYSTKRLNHYDFTSPKAAVESIRKMEYKGDDIALKELYRLRRSKLLEEKWRTFTISKKHDFQDKIIFFVKYNQSGQPVHGIICLEQDLETKLWVPAELDYAEISKLNKELYNSIRVWMDKNVSSRHFYKPFTILEENISPEIK
ncbi:MAG: DUF4339 domain-containing protein [Gemmataceae bacterium]|nr:DUF4339 domain-containing protein [Gemmataceae bacterium]